MQNFQLKIRITCHEISLSSSKNLQTEPSPSFLQATPCLFCQTLGKMREFVIRLYKTAMQNDNWALIVDKYQ